MKGVQSSCRLCLWPHGTEIPTFPRSHGYKALAVGLIELLPGVRPVAEDLSEAWLSMGIFRYCVAGPLPRR